MSRFMRRIPIGLTAVLAMCAAVHASDVRSYNVIWDSPSTNSTGSMPLSGGNFGLNVWAEGNDVLFYIGSPDSRVEDGKLVKLGRVRISFDRPVFLKKFRQELDLLESRILIEGDGLKMEIRADAFDPVAHVEMKLADPCVVGVTYESWRFAAQPITNGLEWVYRLDPARRLRDAQIMRQNAEAIADTVPDPLRDLTIGGRIVGDGLVFDGTGSGDYMRTPFKSWKLKTAAPVRNLRLDVLTRVAQDKSVEAWRSALDSLQRAPEDRAKTRAWWSAFWKRSHVEIAECRTPSAEVKKAPESDTAKSAVRQSAIDIRHSPAWQVGRNYTLFRYMLAANRTGRMPTLFNGGLFTFDNPLPSANAYGASGPNPDERAWWGCHFMAQNQRLVYWPMLKAGDIDLLDVGLNFYRDRAPVAAAKARHFLGAEGTLFTESLDVHGLIAACPSGNGLEAATHLTHHFTSGLEFAYMMLEECRFTGRDPATSLPVAMGMLKFYDSYYRAECLKRTGKPLDDKGHLVIEPGNSCEMGAGCRNHADAIAGLRAITDALLELPGTDCAWLESFRSQLPDLPLEDKGGHRIIRLAESWKSIANPNEFPQLYTIFPFHRFGVGLPDLDLARDTWRYGAFDPKTQKEALCWKYGNIAVADLGLAEEARRYALKKFLYPYAESGGTAHYGNCAPFSARFSAFWVTYPFDAFPDMDHGGCAMIGLQEMLLQTPGDKLIVLPAWPKDWDVDFKLHAPRQTTVECTLRGGKITRLHVTPASRRKDVTIAGPAEPDPVPVSQGRPATASSVWHDPGYDSSKAFDGDSSTRWAVANGNRTGWLEVDLGRPVSISLAAIEEIAWPSITDFAVEARGDDGQWKTVATGGTIGPHRELAFPPVTARHFRLNIKAASNMPNIEEFQLFESVTQKEKK